MNVEKISNYQLFVLIYISIMSTVTILYPPSTAGIDGWIASLMASGYNLLLVGIIYLFFNRHPGKTFFQVIDDLPLIKYPTVFIVVFFLLTLAAITVSDLRAVATLYLISDTPVVVTIGVALLVCMMAAKHGLEIIARLSEFLVTLVIIMIALISIGLFTDIQTENLQPVLELGWKPSLLSSLHIFDFLGIIFVVLFLGPYINEPKEAYKPLLLAVFVMAGVLVLQTIFTIGILGDTLTKQHAFPIVNVARYAKLDFIVGLDAPLLGFWISTIIVKITLILWVTADILARALDLRDKRQLITPLGLLSGVWSLVMFPNVTTLLGFSTIFTLWAISTQFLLPLLLLPLVLLRNNRLKS